MSRLVNKDKAFIEAVVAETLSATV